MAEYKLVVDPDLGVSAQQFVEAWPAADPGGAARLEAAGARHYDAAAWNNVIISLGTGLMASLLYDLIKAHVRQLGARRPARVVEIPQADGSKILLVTVEEP